MWAPRTNFQFIVLTSRDGTSHRAWLCRCPGALAVAAVMSLVTPAHFHHCAAMRKGGSCEKPALVNQRRRIGQW
ncbi:hypothetical protein B5X24_HaOG216784 [Helicoverpa armigera]|nr:hypothetical protein B5X24_HaOG216784 [Helicoverpa armigera]